MSKPGRVQPAGDAARVLRVRLLGPPEIEWAGRPLAMPRRQVRALLYRLAANARPMPREELHFLLWADLPEADARRKLRGLLAHLRRALPDPGQLRTSPDLVELEPGRIRSDAVQFRLLCASRQPAAVELLGRAVDLYRGPFLAGFSLPGSPEYETWAATERQAHERLYLAALSALVEDGAARRDYAGAIGFARAYLATDDLAEPMHRQLIQLYAASGDRAAAQRQFEVCLTTLERELGVSPLPETEAVYRSILDGAAPPGLEPEPVPAWATLPALDIPLVGREPALERLDTALARARDGRGSVLLVGGEAGIGKSRLLQTFAKQNQGTAWVLAGSGYPETAAMPYQPIIEALRPALDTEALASGLSPTWLAEASRLMPELRQRYPSLPTPLPAGPDQARAALFEALCRLTLGLASGALPVILGLDDLHWADGSTLEWLVYLSRRLDGSRVLVLGAYRTEEAGSMSALRHGLARQGRLSELELERLEPGQVLQVVRHLSDRLPGDEPLARQLHELTAGNPFFLLETLAALLESELDPAARLDAGRALDRAGPRPPGLVQPALPLPATVRTAVEARLARLSARARQVLEAGAVLGQAFAFDLLARTSGRGELEAVDSLDELVARQLLKEGEAGYRFSHQIIQAAVYQGLGSHRRRLLHRRAARAMSAQHPGEAPALARHCELAGEPGPAARYALQAGLAAKAVYGHGEARACFERALVLLEAEVAGLEDPQDIADNRRLRVQALYERGWALRLMGDMDAYARDLREVTRLAELLDDPCTMAHLHWREAYTHRWFCRYAEARAAAKLGLALSWATGTCTLVTACRDEGQRLDLDAGCLFEAMCWREVGIAARDMGDYDGARPALEAALAGYVRLGEAVYEIHTLGNLSTLYWQSGDYAGAAGLARRALARCDEAGLPFHRRIPLGDLGVAALALGDEEMARRCLQESLEISRRSADLTQEIFCQLHLGWWHVGLGQPREAAERFRASLDAAERIGSCAEQSSILAGLAEAHRLAGDGEAARGYARRALDHASATGRPHDQAQARRVLEAIDLDTG